MATVTERLAFLLTLDAAGAVKGFRDVGATAEKELKKAEDGIDRSARSMVRFGAGAAGFGATALGALGGLAHMSQEADLYAAKLQNTLENQPQLAGASAAAFEDLAAAIQKKTAADGDAIVGAEAVLGQFGATQAQILGLTPLVVDLSRKMGIDLSAAAAMAGKAISGKATSLQRAGIVIDQAAFATDHYSAVVDALRATVGGFAETEGATFEGRLASLKNQLGDIGETAGAGAVTGFESLLQPVSALTARLNELDPALARGAGQVGVYGATALTAVGGVSVLAGQVMKMRDRFYETTESVDGTTRSLNNYGRVALGVGVVSTMAMVYSLGKAKQEADKASNAMKTAGLSTDEMGGKVTELADFARGRLLPALKVMNGEFDSLASHGANVATLTRFRDAVAAAGYDTKYMDERLVSLTASAKQTAQDSQTAADMISQLGDEATSSATAAVSLANALDYASEAAKSTDARLRALKAATFDLPDAQKAVADGWGAIDDAAQSAGGAVRDVDADMRRARNATEQLTEAQDALADAERNLEAVKKGPTARSVSDAELRLREARVGTERAASTATAAEKKLAELRSSGTATGDEMRDAELAVEEARIRQRRASDELRDAQANLNDVRNVGQQGSKELAAAEDQVASAQRRVRDATEQVAEAQQAAEPAGGAHRDTTKAISDAYDQQVKNIWAAVEAMKEQGTSQAEIDRFIDASKGKLDEYAAKYTFLTEQVRAAKGALDELNVTASGLANSAGGNLVPPAGVAQGIYDTITDRTTTRSSANAAEHRLVARVVVPLVLPNGRELASALIELDRGVN